MIGSKAWIICAVLVCAAANAQVEPSFRQLTIADGLPSSRVMDLTQDRQGFMWVATSDGLARFDGVGFKLYRHDPADAESIPCNDVQSLFEDSQRRLWLGCADRGLGLMHDRDGGRFRDYRTEQQRLGFDSLDVFSIAESGSGQIWLGTFRRGVLRIDAAGTLHRLQDWMQLPEALNTSDVMELLIDSSGALWLGTTQGLWRIRDIDDPTRARAEQLLDRGMVLSIFEAGDHRMWIGSVNAVHRIDVDADAASIAMVTELERVAAVEAIVEDAGGVIWLGTESGLLRWVQGQSPQRISARAAVSHSLPASRVQDLNVDSEGGLWIGTTQGGLVYLRPDRDNFELIRHDALDESSLPPGRLPGAEACPDGRVYAVSNFGGLSEILADGRVRRIGKAPRSLSEGVSTHGLMCAPDGALWLGRANAVTRLNPDTGAARVWTVDDGIVPGFVELLAAGSNGEVWMSSLGSGITRIDAAGRISTWQTAERGIAIADFEQLSVAPDGRIWLADAQGMRVVDPGTELFRATEGGPQERVTAFALDTDGGLWTVSAQGLAHWQVQGFALRQLQLIGADKGLPVVEFYAMLIDAGGHIWLTSARGLWHIEPARQHVELVNSRVGLPSLQYIPRPILRMAGNKVLTTTLEGVLRFDAKRLTTVATPPPLLLASASIRRGDIRVDLDPMAERWDLRWDDRDLRVEARVLSYADPSANHYGFLLDGHDTDWVDTGARPEREFTRIESGSYPLHIRASNVAGVPAINELQRTLHVASPPWWTWQAWLAYTLSLMALVWFAFTGWRRRIERHHRMALADERRRAAELANSAKSDFLADVGHEIRTPMSGVLGMADLLVRSSLDSDQRRWAVSIKRSGEHMLRLINDLLDLSRIEAGKLEVHVQPTELSALLDEVRTLEAPLAQARGIGFVTHIDPGLPPWVLCDGRRLRQILLNLINNALKFTERGEVSVSITRPDADFLLVEVRDSGPGMSADQVASLFARFRQTDSGRQKGGSGLGLAISAQLAHLLGGVIDAHSAPGQGSQFRLRIPLQSCGAPVDVGTRPEALSDLNEWPLTGIGVLLVEDDPAIREVNARLLESLGARVQVAPHALDALSRFMPGQERIALIDLDLPSIDGLQLIALLRSRAGPGALLTVAVTARSAADTERRCRDAGFDGFMRKPVSAEQLREAARGWRARLDEADQSAALGAG
jgi:signal transduction histidine kinase/CheY-like chemotaxis protein/streptogramin lyase